MMINTRIETMIKQDLSSSKYEKSYFTEETMGDVVLKMKRCQQKNSTKLCQR